MHEIAGGFRVVFYDQDPQERLLNRAVPLNDLGTPDQVVDR